MLAKCLAVALVFSIPFSQTAAAVSQQQINEKEAAQTEEVKKEAARYKVGKKVVLNLRENKRQVKGTITMIDANGVTISEKESGQPFSAAYTQLTKIKGDGSVIKHIVGAGVAAGIVIAVVAIYSYAKNE